MHVHKYTLRDENVTRKIQVMNEELYERAVKERELFVAKCTTSSSDPWLDGVCHFKIVGPKAQTERIHGACHFLMCNPSVVKPEFVVNHIYNIDRVGEAKALAFYEWLLNYSPYAEVFATKSAREVLDTKAAIATCEAPNNLLVGGLVATRSTYEHAGVCVAWYDLVDRGVHPDVAFVTAHVYNGGLKPTSITHNPIGHAAIYGYYGLNEQLDAFINHKPHNAGPMYTKAPTYDSFQKLWMGGKLIYVADQINMALLDVKPTNKSSNVFTPNKMTSAYEAQLEAIVPILKKVK